MDREHEVEHLGGELLADRLLEEAVRGGALLLVDELVGFFLLGLAPEGRELLADLREHLLHELPGEEEGAEFRLHVEIEAAGDTHRIRPGLEAELAGGVPRVRGGDGGEEVGEAVDVEGDEEAAPGVLEAGLGEAPAGPLDGDRHRVVAAVGAPAGLPLAELGVADGPAACAGDPGAVVEEDIDEVAVFPGDAGEDRDHRALGAGLEGDVAGLDLALLGLGGEGASHGVLLGDRDPAGLEHVEPAASGLAGGAGGAFFLGDAGHRTDVACGDPGIDQVGLLVGADGGHDGQGAVAGRLELLGGEMGSSGGVLLGHDVLGVTFKSRGTRRPRSRHERHAGGPPPGWWSGQGESRKNKPRRRR